MTKEILFFISAVGVFNCVLDYFVTRHTKFDSSAQMAGGTAYIDDTDF